MLVLDMKTHIHGAHGHARPHWVLGGLLLLAVMAASALSTLSASAISNVGLDPTEFGNEARYALEESGNVRGADNIRIPVYYMHSGAPGTAPARPPTDMVIRVYDIGPRRTPNNGVIINGGPATTGGVRDVTISRNDFSYRTDINAWTAMISASMSLTSGDRLIQFRLQVRTPSAASAAKIGYSASNSDSFASANRFRCDEGGDITGCGVFYNYRIPFGVPCSLNAPRTAQIRIRDGDNNRGGRSEYTIQHNRQFSVRIINTTTGAVVNDNRLDPGSSTDDGGTAIYSFTVVPDNKYEFRVNDVYTNNVLQFRLPYDSIESISNCNWDLRPAVNLSSNQAESNTSGITVTSTVSNNGPAATPSVNWQLTRCVFAPGVPSSRYGAVADNTLNGVQTYSARGGDCRPVTSASRTFPTTSPTTVNVQNDQSIGDEETGTNVCFILSLNPPTRSSGATTWRHSTPSCVIVVKKPKLHVLGGDVIVGRAGGGAIATSSSTKQISGVTRTYGSWGEYALVASGDIFSMASGAGYSGGATSSAYCSVSLLTFANAINGTSCTASTTKGQYAIGGSFPALASRFSATVPIGNNQTANLTSLQSRTIYSATGTLRLQNGAVSMPAGKWVVINAPNATVVIENDIRYAAGPFGSLNDIPQLIIIANNITVAESVTQVDAWLMATGASGRLNTCGGVSAATQLRSTNCRNPLVINGPVAARQLLLYRTAGAEAGSNSGAPAEVFNLRPDAYLWAINYQSDSGRVQTVYTKELPPRF